MALLFGSCANELVARTELVLVADTDVPLSSIVKMGFHVVHRDGNGEDTSGKVTSKEDLPLTLTLEHEAGELGPVFVSAFVITGPDAMKDRFERTHEVRFVAGKTLVVPLYLSNQCVKANTCEPLGLECTEHGKCAPQRMDNLGPWTGHTPHSGGDELDASMNPISEDDAGMEPQRDAGLAADAGPSDSCSQCEEMFIDDDTAAGKHIHGVCGADMKCHEACNDGWVSCSPNPHSKKLGDDGCEEEAPGTCDDPVLIGKAIE
jgi:hypothetical protein